MRTGTEHDWPHGRTWNGARSSVAALPSSAMTRFLAAALLAAVALAILASGGPAPAAPEAGGADAAAAEAQKPAAERVQLTRLGAE